MNTLRIVLITAVIGMGIAACTQDAPSFSGTWELNPKKGENLGMVAAVKETVVISQTGQQLVIDFTDVFQGNTTTRQVTYDLSGKPMVNFAAMGDRSETVSTWKDGELVTLWTSEGAVAGTSVVRTETRSLSGDGDTMTVANARGDNPAMVLVYERQ
ncbi:MAG: hypothetical protein ACE5G3_05025 [Gammaproteobacteria bacterium]